MGSGPWAGPGSMHIVKKFLDVKMTPLSQKPGKPPSHKDLALTGSDSASLTEPYRCCVLCPRQCRVNRTDPGPASGKGVCGETDQLRVAYVGPHFGEEPPITGTNGSGTVFFTGCSLRCTYCQNHQISQGGLGVRINLDELAVSLEQMVERHHVSNINWVTPDHFFPHVFDLVRLLRGRGIDLPFVYNLSGYQSVEALASAEDFADIYLPDFKYSDPVLAAALS